MKRLILTTLTIATFLFSCNKLEDLKINENCLDNKPTKGNIYVNVSINNDIKSVPIEIRLDNYHSGQLLIRDTLYENEKIFEVDVNNYYVVSAEYKKEKLSTISIDGGKVSTRKNSTEDGTECWNLRNFRARVFIN